MNFLKSLVQKFTGRPVDWDELEEMLIRADLGVPMTLRILEALQERAQTTTITSNDIARSRAKKSGASCRWRRCRSRPLPGKPKCL